MKALSTSGRKCSGCSTCQLVCSQMHTGLFSPRNAAIRIEPSKASGEAVQCADLYTPHLCRQCEPAPCAEACPADAFERDGSGVWRINRAECTGCGLCQEACEFRMIVLTPAGQAVKCDLCRGEPFCVRFCPTRTLDLS